MEDPGVSADEWPALPKREADCKEIAQLGDNADPPEEEVGVSITGRGRELLI